MAAHTSPHAKRRSAQAFVLTATLALFGWSVLLTHWAAPAASAQEVTPSQDQPFAELLSKLDQNKRYWNSYGVATSHYTFSYSVSCSCPSSPEITVTVVNDQVSNVTTSDGSAVSNPRTIESLFQEIRGHIDTPAARLEVRFHSPAGYPLEFSVDPDAMSADDEYTVTVRSLRLAQTQRVLTALDAAEQRWEAAGVDGDHYVLTYREICFLCLRDLYRTVTVVDDQALEATDSLGRDALRWAESVDSLFDRIRESTRDVTLVSASFDETYGYPTDFYMNPLPRITDQDTGFIVTEHRPLGDVPVPDVDVEVRCFREDGRIDLLIDSNHPADGPVDYEINIGTVASRTRALLGGAIHREFASGRYDARHTVTLRLDELTVWRREVTVECDPARSAEVEVETSCLGGNGRVDVYLTNPGPPQTNVTDDIYEVTIGSLAGRITRLYPGDLTARVTATGRPDGPLTVVVTKDYVEIAREVTIACDPART